jgi:small subunit ribosomal protein S19e
MGNIFDVPVNEFILKLAAEMKKVEQIRPPEWSLFCKTGVHKERPPVQSDWWFIRAAAILRSVKILGPVGTQKLRAKYGGRRHRGYRTEHFFKGSGSVVRKILQQLEKAGFIKQVKKDVHKGRVVTPAGDKFLNTVAIALMKARNIVIPKRPDVELKVSIPKKKKSLPKAKPAKAEASPEAPKKKRVYKRKKKEEAPAVEAKTEAKAEVKTEIKAEVGVPEVKE